MEGVVGVVGFVVGASGRPITKAVPTVQPERGRGQKLNPPDILIDSSHGKEGIRIDYRTVVG